MRDAGELREQAAAENDGWRTLRAEATLTLQMFPRAGTAAGTERRQFRAVLLVERPARLRLRATEGERAAFDLLWFGTTPQLSRPLPQEERSSRLREVIASLCDDVRVALRMEREPTRVEMAQAVAVRPEPIPLFELREYAGKVLVARSAYDRESLLRRRLEQGRGGEIERTIHFANHAPAGTTHVARLWVVDNERFDYSMTVEIEALAVDQPLPPASWVP